MGGNLIVWGSSEKNPPSLHAFWDDLVAARPADVLRQVAALLSKYPREHFERDLGDMDSRNWALDSFKLATKAYDRFLKESEYDDSVARFQPPSRAYRTWAMEVAQERAALAAFRLADLLVATLPPIGEDGGGGPPATANRRARRKTRRKP
jgi:hypothetical protein